MQHVVDELFTRRVSRSRHGAPITRVLHACQCCVCRGAAASLALPLRRASSLHELNASRRPRFAARHAAAPSSDFEDFNWISGVWQAAIKSRKLPLKQIVKIWSKAAVRSPVGPKTFLLFYFCIMTEVKFSIRPLALLPCCWHFFFKSCASCAQVVSGGKLEDRKAGEGAGASLASLPLTHLLLLTAAYALHGCSNKLRVKTHALCYH
jgi:hypothetical protein